MAKRLNTTFVFGDPETGEAKTVVAGDKLSAADMKVIKEGWGARADQFFDDDGEDDAPEQRPLQETSPQADRVPSDPATPQVEEAMKINEDVRTKATPAGAKDSGKK